MNDNGARQSPAANLTYCPDGSSGTGVGESIVRDVLARIAASIDSLLAGDPDDAADVLGDLEAELVDVLHDLGRAA